MEDAVVTGAGKRICGFASGDQPGTAPPPADP
jgi:hypothetical protein